MAKTWAKAPTPCIGVCKFDNAGFCRGCAMNKREKKSSKKLKGKSEKRSLFTALVARLAGLGRLEYWTRMYDRKCHRKGAENPLPKLNVAASRPET
jgi:uncharacterized protein